MFTLALIGIVGGLISGISPCILPVLPVIFYSGAQSSADDVAAPRQLSGAVATAVNTKRVLSQTLRP
jgi:cytochrome c biogenesis protein CcdA